jgi:predicted transposase/invertase (TIGR01784 family)
MANGEMIKQDDSLWKCMVEDLFPDFIRFFYPKDCGTFDLRHFDFLDKELQKMFPDIETATDRRFVDKLVKARRINGKEEWTLVHIEIQGYPDEQFSERMFTYWTRLRDRYKQPVTAIAIFTDANNRIPDHCKIEVLGTRLEYHYNTYRVCEQPEYQLRESKNPFALIVLAARIALFDGQVTDSELMIRYEWIYRALEGIELPDRKKQAIHAFLSGCVHFADSKTYSTFNKELKAITGKSNVMGTQEYLKAKGREEGLEEGREEGRKEEKVLLVKSLLASNQFTIAQISDFVKVSQDFVREIEEGVMVE